MCFLLYAEEFLLKLSSGSTILIMISSEFRMIIENI